MSGEPQFSVSHFGICISDLERSTGFYTEALGFQVAHTVEAGPPFDRLSEVPELKLRAPSSTGTG